MKNSTSKKNPDTLAQLDRELTQTIDDVVQADEPKLFYVSSTETVNGFYDVPVMWFADRCTDGVEMPWAMLIKDYNPHAVGLGYTQDAVREMLTETEAEAVVEHLRKIGDGAGAPTMEPVQLPVENCLVPLSDDCFDVDVTFPLPDTGLPLAVRGHCRLNGHLLIREEKIGNFVIYWGEGRSANHLLIALMRKRGRGMCCLCWTGGRPPGKTQSAKARLQSPLMLDDGPLTCDCRG